MCHTTLDQQSENSETVNNETTSPVFYFELSALDSEEKYRTAAVRRSEERQLPSWDDDTHCYCDGEKYK